ncbi:MAG: O-antigen ligase family protein [Tissierellaceae bacterium]|nr:O-antigen ligase family protein [Tissierellaceae bacterium]
MLHTIKNQENINLYTISLFMILTILPLFDAGFNNNLPMYMLLFALVVLFIKNNIYRDEINLSIKSPLLWYSLYLIWCGISFIWSIYYIRTVMELFELLLYGAIFFITLQLNDEDNDKVISVVLLIGSGIALLGILEYIFITNSRIVSTFTNPNPFGTYLLILFLFSWGTSLNTKRKSFYIPAFIFLVALLLSGSRGGYFSTIIGLPFIFIGSDKKELIHKFIKTIILFFIALITTRIIMYIAPIAQDNVGLAPSMVDALIRKDTLIGSSLVGRLEFWKVAWELIKNKPILGYGQGTFFSAYYIEYSGNQWYSRFVHNHYLQIMAETGIIGIILFLGFLLSIFRILYIKLKSKNYSTYLPGTIAAIVGFLIHIGAEFSFNFPGATVIFFWLLGMAVKNYNFEKDNNRLFTINYKFKNIILILLVILVLYNFTFFKLFSFATKIALNGDRDKALDIIEFSNKYYPISPYGYQLEGEYYHSIYKDSKDNEDLNKAISLYEKALNIASFDGGIHNKLGNLYLEASDLPKAEEHLRYGADYGAYNINRYIDLGLFYMNQNRLDDAQKVFLKGADLKEYAIKSASAEEKDSMVINALTLHAMLYNMYKNDGDEINLSIQIEELNNMMDKYPFLKEYFNMDRFID